MVWASLMRVALNGIGFFFLGGEGAGVVGVCVLCGCGCALLCLCACAALLAFASTRAEQTLHQPTGQLGTVG